MDGVGTAGGTADRGDGRGAEATVVLDASGQWFADESRIVEHGLRARPGVLAVAGDAVAQTVTVRYDPAVTSPEQLRRWVIECGYHCDGESAPRHVCVPPAAAPAQARDDQASGAHAGHGGMSMAAMARDLRDRFIVAAVLAVPIMLWSPMGTALLGRELTVPFGLPADVFLLLLSLPVVFYSSAVFFRGAAQALRNHTLDMMVLVAVAIAAGWGYSVAVTFGIDGEVFYEAAAFLAAFVLLGHWLEMRARGGANEAIRALLDMAPPKAVVVRDGETVEVPTGEVVVGDELLIRPGARCRWTPRSSTARAMLTSRW